MKEKKTRFWSFDSAQWYYVQHFLSLKKPKCNIFNQVFFKDTEIEGGRFWGWNFFWKNSFPTLLVCVMAVFLLEMVWFTTEFLSLWTSGASKNQFWPTKNGGDFPHGWILCVTFATNFCDEFLWWIFVTNFCDEFLWWIFWTIFWDNFLGQTFWTNFLD